MMTDQAFVDTPSKEFCRYVVNNPEEIQMTNNKTVNKKTLIEIIENKADHHCF
jgi:hypothetical protein